MWRQLVLVSALAVYVLAKNEIPIIGVLSQESYSVDGFFPDETYKSFISAGYVKHLEAAGARVVPIWIGRDDSYYQEIVNYTNGVFWPGGAAFFNDVGKYADAGRALYKFALEANKNGDYYPLWATCLGMELLAEIPMNKVEARITCTAKNYAIPLDFKPDFKNSKMFGNASDDVIDILKTQNVTFNYHKYCITEDMFVKSNLLNDWKILSTNKDQVGLEFVSSFESIHYPFYGIQFHPEKNQFEFNSSKPIPHSRDAVKVAHYFADFFVEECRNNNHKFPDVETEQSALIYNYSPYYVGKLNSAYQQVYMFDAVTNNS